MPAPAIAARAASWPWLAAVLALAPGVASAQGVSVPLAALATAIAGWASAETGLPMATRAPAIAYADYAEMAALRRADPSGHSTAPQRPGAPWPEVIAVYDTRSRTIVLPAGWTGGTPADLSVLVHEMVHHLQTEAGRRFACPREREQAAFAAQERWLELFGSSLEREFQIDPMFLLVATHCVP
jgi:hypothetical protein